MQSRSRERLRRMKVERRRLSERRKGKGELNGRLRRKKQKEGEEGDEK